jgi:hypothetical protein
VFLGVSALAASGPFSTVRADSFRLEAETYATWGNSGGFEVQAVECSGASNGLGVKGVDSPGDWMALRHEFTTKTCFTDSLRSQGQAGLARNYIVLYEPDPPVLTSSGDTTLTVAGGGIG